MSEGTAAGHRRAEWKKDEVAADWDADKELEDTR
jgi:hypothetical protein